MVSRHEEPGGDRRLIDAARRAAARLRADGTPSAACGSGARGAGAGDAGAAEPGASAPADPGTPARGAGLPDAFPGYRVLAEVQRGGQGVVYRARQESTRREVAIKVVRDGALAGADARARMDREVEVLARLDDPRIVAVRDSGIAQGTPFFVMDWVAGQPLDVWVASGPRGVRRVVELLAEVAEAVGVAHLVGVVHRDLKPGNVIVDTEGRPHVLDFGLAKLLRGPAEPAELAAHAGSAGSAGGALDSAEIGAQTEPGGARALTETGQFVGSLPWASPEQAAGDARIDVRTDVYSLGVMLYQALTGCFPYEVVGNLVDVVRRIQAAEPARPRGLAGALGDELETILGTCLQKERERRYQSAGELARDLRRWLAGEPIAAKRDSALYLLRKVLRRHWVPASVAAAFVVLGAVALGVTLRLWGSARAQRDRAELAVVDAREARATAEAERERLRRSTYFQSIRLAQYAVTEDNGERATALLAECPPDLRGWEWRRMRWLVDRSTLRLTGHAGNVVAVAFGPAGRRVVSVGPDGVRVWHAASGHLERAFAGHGAEPRAAVFYLDGEHVVSGDADGVLLRWSVASGEIVERFALGDGITALARTGDGRLVAGDAAGGVRVLDRAGEVALDRPAVVAGPVTALALAPDDAALFVGGEGGQLVRCGLAERGDLRFPPAGGADAALAQSAGSDAAALAQSSDGDVAALAASADGTRLASGGSDGWLRLWDARTGTELVSVAAHRPWVYGVDFDPYGRYVVTCGADHAVKLWDPETGALTKTLRGHTDRVFAVACDLEGRRVVSGGGDDAVLVWDARAPESARRYPGHAAQVWSVRCAPEGSELATASSDGTVKAWSARDAAVLPRTIASGGPAPGGRGGAQGVDTGFLCVAWDAEGRRVATGGADGGVRLWAAATGELLSAIPGARPVGAVGADGAGGADGSGADGAVGHRGSVFAVDLDPGGARVASFGADGTARVHDATTGAPLLELDAGEALFTGAFDPSGTRLAAGTALGHVRVWDAATGAERLTLASPRRVWRLAWSPDGTRLATAHHDGVARVWDAASGALVRELAGHRGGVRCVAWWPDGARLVTGGWDETLRVWDAASGAEALVLRGHEGRVESVDVTPDGRAIVSADVYGGLLCWESVEPARDE